MKLKIAVYAICKNEEQFAARWASNVNAADGIFVLDTGSTDNTVQILRDHGVNVETQIFAPWRFDRARNSALQLIPADYDICLCTDLDELLNDGWRNCIEDSWQSGANIGNYEYWWKVGDGNSAGVRFIYNKLHARKGFYWRYPVHEIIVNDKKTAVKPCFIKNMVLKHYPDERKSRSNYLPLLEFGVKEMPYDTRMRYYLGREYFFAAQWQKSIDTMTAYLNLKNAQWADERCSAMRYIARAYSAMSKQSEAKNWLIMAASEAPHLREPLVEIAHMCMYQNNPLLALAASEKALRIKHRTLDYITEGECWDERPFLLSAKAARLCGYDSLAESREREAKTILHGQIN